MGKVFYLVALLCAQALAQEEVSEFVRITRKACLKDKDGLACRILAKTYATSGNTEMAAKLEKQACEYGHCLETVPKLGPQVVAKEDRFEVPSTTDKDSQDETQSYYNILLTTLSRCEPYETQLKDPVVANTSYKDKIIGSLGELCEFEREVTINTAKNILSCGFTKHQLSEIQEKGQGHFEEILKDTESCQVKNRSE